MPWPYNQPTKSGLCAAAMAQAFPTSAVPMANPMPVPHPTASTNVSKANLSGPISPSATSITRIAPLSYAAAAAAATATPKNRPMASTRPSGASQLTQSPSHSQGVAAAQRSFSPKKNLPDTHSNQKPNRGISLRKRTWKHAL